MKLTEQREEISALRYRTARVGGHGKRNVNRRKDRNDEGAKTEMVSETNDALTKTVTGRGSVVYPSNRTDRQISAVQSRCLNPP